MFQAVSCCRAGDNRDPQPLTNDDTCSVTEMLSRRRLGQTQLTPRMVSGQTPENAVLGTFDYAHLRAPLPKGIVSDLFKSSPNSYFLMRRSKDGFVSATGMFKATFPWAKAEEEEMERAYLKSKPTTSPDETAGNIWIPPEEALILAEEYKILPWIRALLDPSDILPSTGGDSGRHIQAPPKFDLRPVTPIAPPVTLTSTGAKASSRGGRAASPSKAKKGPASPRKRSAKGTAAAEKGTAAAEKTTTTKEAPPPAAPVAKKEPAAAQEPREEEPKVTVKVGQETKVKDGVETTVTEVDVEVKTTGELPSAEETAKMVADAKEMVHAAAASVAAGAATGPVPTAANKKTKRKAAELEPTEPAAEGSSGAASSSEGPQAKKAKTKTDDELRRERVKKRALVGIGVTAGIAYVLHFIVCVLRFRADDDTNTRCTAPPFLMCSRGSKMPFRACSRAARWRRRRRLRPPL